ncbi:putative YigZ family protein [Stackebrandtia albiflava]|uniref:Putative YigZ family protein n=1 Tax=Stackebrandtia albiflava TaxID=406432 RepID=A0A562VDP2_9ACTN|nr:YigZ family protein [Stackebrandtia albiflava]TWJ15978.1 putative YigZ family protein [Stackebrandtia albiflava]
MRTIRGDIVHELVIHRSRFICALARVADEAAARAFITERRRAHWNAGHHCTAYVVGGDGRIRRSSDDGEPGGTAGLPMLEVLRHRELVEVVAVVSRYFGGVKLGAGGLVRAYGGVVSEAVDLAGTVELLRLPVVTVVADYRDGGGLEAELRRGPDRLLDVRYGDDIEFDVATPDPERLGARLASMTGGAAVWQTTGETVVEAG